jgi:hypothetical protein
MPDSTPKPSDSTPEPTEEFAADKAIEAKSDEGPKPSKGGEVTRKAGHKDDKPKEPKPVVWPPHHPVRTFLAAIFGSIAFVLIIAAILAVWFNRTITDTDTYVRTITPLAEQQDIQNFVADRVTEGIVKGAATEADLVGIVPQSEIAGKDVEELQTLARNTVRKNVLDVIQSANFQRLWHESNRNAHDKLISQLSTNKKEISVDFTPLIDGVMKELGNTSLGPLTQSVVLPQDIGKVNMNGVAIDKVSDYYNWLQKTTWSLVAAAAAATAICIALSTHHIRTFRRIMMVTGVATLTMALILQLPSWTQGIFGSTAQKVAVAVGDVLFHDLKIILLIIGITAIILALLSKVISVARRKIPQSKTLNLNDKPEKK